MGAPPLLCRGEGTAKELSDGPLLVRGERGDLSRVLVRRFAHLPPETVGIGEGSLEPGQVAPEALEIEVHGDGRSVGGDRDRERRSGRAVSFDSRPDARSVGGFAVKEHCDRQLGTVPKDHVALVARDRARELGETVRVRSCDQDRDVRPSEGDGVRDVSVTKPALLVGAGVVRRDTSSGDSLPGGAVRARGRAGRQAGPRSPGLPSRSVPATREPLPIVTV